MGCLGTSGSSACSLHLGFKHNLALKNDVLIGAKWLTFDIGNAAFKTPGDHFAARHLSDTYISLIVGQHHDITREERSMRSSEVQQHAVITSNGDDLHALDNRSHLSATPYRLSTDEAFLLRLMLRLMYF